MGTMAVTDGRADSGFGVFLRDLRQEKEIGQRKLARRLGISAPYLNDIEKGKRPAPKEEILRNMAEALEADLQRMFDLAAQSRNEIPEDVANIIKQNPEITPLVRAIADYGLDGQKIKEVKKNIESSNVKGLIIAAGMGSRLNPYTDDLPKCMLKFHDKTLLERQLAAFDANGIRNISVIRGYRKEKIHYPGLKYFENFNYENNNILNSLFCAEKEINGNVVISYSDILFEDQVITRLLQSTHNISIVVDIDWREHYVGRKDHPYEEAESVIFDADNNVVEIGKMLTAKNDMHGEFIGMMKLTPRGAEVFKKHFEQAKALYNGKPFQRAQDFQKAYLTDFIQHIVNLGVHVHCVIIERGWKEIDTVEDYEKALVEFEE